METRITRLDYKNPINGRKCLPPSLPALENAKEITDINEVYSVSFTFDSKEEAEIFVANFPKSYRPRIATLAGIPDGKGGFTSKPFADITFNTFWIDKTTGNINETAVYKREKFVKKLKSINI